MLRKNRWFRAANEAADSVSIWPDVTRESACHVRRLGWLWPRPSDLIKFKVGGKGRKMTAEFNKTRNFLWLFPNWSRYAHSCIHIPCGASSARGRRFGIFISFLQQGRWICKTLEFMGFAPAGGPEQTDLNTEKYFRLKEASVVRWQRLYAAVTSIRGKNFLPCIKYI